MMKDLKDIRSEIDQIDRQMRELFVRRMALSEQIAVLKAESGDSIYKPEREKEVVAGQAGDMDPALTDEYTVLIRKVMGVSRQYQYKRILALKGSDVFKESELLSDAANRNETEKNMVEGLAAGYPGRHVFLIRFSCGDPSRGPGDILSVITDHGVRILELYTDPGEDPDSEGPLFYAALKGDTAEEAVRALLFQLREETEDMKILQILPDPSDKGDDR